MTLYRVDAHRDRVEVLRDGCWNMLNGTEMELLPPELNPIVVGSDMSIAGIISLRYVVTEES